MAGVIPAIDIRRGDDRFRTKISWLDSYHSFSFSRHYDPQNTHFGLLLVSNDDVIAAESGFQTHPHQDMEIVTWVIRGENRAPGLRGEQRRHLPGTRTADERRQRHLALGDERVEGWRCPPRADVGRAGHAQHRAELPAARHRQRGREGRARAGGLGPRPRVRDRHPPGGRHPLGRGSSPQASRRRCPPHRSPTSTWPKATSNSRVAASSSAATPPASPTNPAYG